MKKGFEIPTKSDKSISALVCSLLLLGSLFLLFSIIPSSAQSQGPVLQLSPTQGAPGTIVSVYGLGFPSGASVSIDFGERHMTNGYPGMFGRISTTFTVPSVPYGTYTVTGTGAGGIGASATFVVSSVSSSSSTGSVQIPTNLSPTQGTDLGGSSFGFTSIPTQAPVKAKTESWSPLVIGAVVAVVVIGILFPTVFIIRRRGRPEASTYEESKPQPYPSSKPPYGQSSTYRKTSSSFQTGSSYGLGSSYQQRKPSFVSSTYKSSSSYGNQMISRSPVVHHRYTGSTAYNSPSTIRNTASPYRPGQPNSYSSSGSTKTCSHCKRSIKTDYSVCPYCRKRT